MIVADTNLLAYFLLQGEFTDLAERVYLQDADWHAPLMWRAEFCNVLLLHIRHNDLEPKEAHGILADAVAFMRGREHEVAPEAVLECAGRIGCSAYDPEFVNLAETMGCSLVTSDRRLLVAASHASVSLQDFAGGTG